MRNVTELTVSAFLNGRTASVSNTFTNGKELYLHGNKIAMFNSEGKLEISLCGWNTVTTRERLNGIFEIGGYKLRVSTKKGQAMINGIAINDDRYYVISTF